MSAQKFYPYNGRQVSAKEIAAMKYPVAPLVTIQRLLRNGMSVQDILDRDLLKAQQDGLKAAQKKGKANSTTFTITNTKPTSKPTLSGTH